MFLKEIRSVETSDEPSHKMFMAFGANKTPLATLISSQVSTRGID